MTGIIDLVLASPLNVVIVIAAVAVSGRLLVDGAYVAALGLLVPLAVLTYLAETDAALMR
ncbi:hypothetical protein [Halobaculum marinum]|uniref:Uncharacterized protein n=1 Tax=Halobaculum marinum TaxID=3031996 RepID=A0ABD5X539_9EURY|nr:hypothetical protein [Halobaculum sp. DT55]